MPEGLRIEFERSGGVAGAILRTSVDTADLPPDEARELEGLVAEADLSAVARGDPGPGGRPDRFQYRLSVSRGQERHQVSLGESEVPARVKPLLDRLLQLARQR